jgi:hypothetical protein
MVKEGKRTFFKLGKVCLYFFLLQEPYIAQNIGKNNLKKDVSNTEKLLQYRVCISAWRDDIDEITELF